MNIREISDVFKDTAADITALKSYNFGWASDRVRQGNTEDFQELNAFPRVFFSVPTITASDQTRKQDTYQVTLFFDDLLGYDNDGDADLTLQIDKWAALQQYATAFIQRLNLIKQTILPNYLFIPEPPQFTFDSFVGIQRLVTVQVNFNLVVPTNCEVTVQRIINVVGNVIAEGLATGNIFLSTSVSALIECTATATGAIVSGQQNIIEVESNVTAFALASGDIVTVKTVAASVVSTATVQAEVQRAVNVIGQLNATGQVSGNISLTLFATGSVDAQATVDANLQVTTQGVVSCEGNVTGTGVMSGSLFVIRTLEAQSIGQATSQSEIILSKLLSASVAGSGVSEGSIQRIISVESSIDTAVTTSADATLTKVLDASATATAQTSIDAQITIPVNADATATANTSADAQLSYTVNANATATAQTSADAFFIRIISADASATANSSAEAGIGVTFVAAAVSTASIVSADLFRTATMESSITAQANVTGATLTTVDNVTASVSAAATVTNANMQLFDPYFSSVSLLLHGNGTDGSTSFIDSSSNSLSVTGTGNAQIDTAIKQFGTGSLLFDGNGDNVAIANNSILTLGTGNFTIELWIYPLSQVGSFNSIIGGNASGEPIVNLRGSGTSSSISFNIFGSADIFNLDYTFTQNNWYHIAISRSGTSLKVYINGSQIGSTITDSTNISAPLTTVGGLIVAYSQYFNGNIDDVRITKGVARYTGSSLTVPTREFLDQ